MRRTAPWAALVAILVATAVAYGPALDGPFQLDDWNAIQANPRVRAPGGPGIPSLPALLGPSRPVTELTFALDWQGGGGEPGRFHRVGLLLHLGTVLLAFAFSRALLRRAGHPRADGIAAVAAGALALHPIQAEAVAYAAQRSEVLASALYLATLLLLDAAAAARSRAPAAVAWVSGVLAWIAAMGAKTIAISAPGSFLAEQAVVAPSGGDARRLRARVARALVLSLPVVALAAWSAALHLRAFAAAPGGGAGFDATPLSPLPYFLTQLRVSWLYLRLLAWPHPLGLDRSFAASEGLDGATALAGLGVLLLLALAAWLFLRAERRPGPAPAERIAAFGILFWFAVLAPSSSFVPVLDLAVEHRVYLAALGPFLAAAVGGDALLRRLLPARAAAPFSAALAAVLLAGMAVGLHGRARLWRSAEDLWRDAAATSPGSPRILTNLGLALQEKGDVAGADAAYRAAWEVARLPLHVVGLARNHASLLVDSGDPAAALPVLARGLAVAPDDPDLRANRAAALVALGRIPEAVTDARRAAAGAPDSAFVQDLLGQVLAASGDWPGALAAFAAASRLDPAEPGHALGEVDALLALGRHGEACGRLAALRSRFPPDRLPPDLGARAAAAGCVAP